MERLTIIILLLLTLLAAVADAQETDADRLHVVLINGGRNRLTNHERYWNDCALLYRTLRQTYHVPRRNITVLMSDGGDPAPDMLLNDVSGFASSPTDLDGDGEADVTLGATNACIELVLTELAGKLTPDDRLFLFMIDHGDIDSQWGEPFVWLWNNERLRASELATLLNHIRVSAVSVLLGQCHAGGFLTALQREGRVVAAACSVGEQSWACPDRPYDEFVYHWVCAVNKADETGCPVDADSDGDGLVTMQEAFDYARAHDRRPETPQYASWPESMGRQWAFDGMSDTGVSDVTDSPTDVSVYSTAGIRQSAIRRSQLYIVSRRGQPRKKVLKTK